MKDILTNSWVSKARQQGNYITLIGGKEGTEGIGTSSIMIWSSSSSSDAHLCHNNNILILTTAQIAKQEAQRKRKQQAAQAAEAQKRREGGDLSKDLFAAPTRAVSLLTWVNFTTSQNRKCQLDQNLT